MESEDSHSDSGASNSSDSSDDSDTVKTEWNPVMNQNQRSFSEMSPLSNAILVRASPKRSSTINPHSDSDSTSSSYSGNDEGIENMPHDTILRSKNNDSPMHKSCEENSRDEEENTTITRNQSISSSSNSSLNSSHHSSSSTNESRCFNPNKNILSVANDDLSDVSEIDCEKRDFKNFSMESLIDSKTNQIVSKNSKKKDIQSNIPNEDKRENLTPIQSTHDQSQDAVITDLRQKLDQKKNQLKVLNIDYSEKTETTNGSKFNGSTAESLENLVKAHDEDALDFEAEEGECLEVSNDEKIETEVKENKINKSVNEAADGEELEEGEVSDEDEKRPEETEPRPVCRFYTRGQCTWGTSCRFLHPGVTDKGNYTMFDLVRPVPVPQSSTGAGRSNQNFGGVSLENFHDYRTDRPPLNLRNALHHPISVTYSQSHHDPRSTLPPSVVQDPPVVVESAWERGLRTAKEMMRKANKRKEQDMDFEDKKMNLTLSPDELEKDVYYIKDRTSPPDLQKAALSYSRHAIYQESSSGIYSPPERFIRGPPMPVYDELDPYGRSSRYRELPPHRMPQYEDDRRVRPAREVIVQRVEPVGRGDEWNDPWMRSKSPGGRALSDKDRSDKRRRECRSFSSHSSYSSSSSSQSDSSSVTSRSLSPLEKRRRYNNSTHKSPLDARRHARSAIRSPSLRRKRSPSPRRRSPISKRRNHLSPSSLVEKRNKRSPIIQRKKTTPVKKLAADKDLSRHQRSSSSASGSSDSSGTDSDSSATSSTETSSPCRNKTPIKRLRAPEKFAIDRKLFKKDMPKKRSPISIEIKKQTVVGTSALTSPTTSISFEKDTKKTRREELLKQLRAVEDAIAKKRSKLV